MEQLFKSYKIFQIKESKLEKSYHTTLNPIEKKDLNIILIIGESMRAKEFTNSSYKIFENYTYKTIYSGATNTDVSIPLLLNGAPRPSKIDLKANLFTLAKKNGFDTSFITAQSDQYLKYIQPYLQKDDIDTIKILNSLDEKLFKILKTIDLNRSNFITLQMQGEHSPYIYYPNAKENDSIKIRYQNSMKYSSEILTKIINYIKQNSQKPYIVLFTSDHGEQIGINGKYGHNRFEEEIYKVPLIFNSNFIKMPSSILSHNDIYQLLLYHLGYSDALKFHRPINIYGTMITEEDGFIQIKP